MSRRIGLITDWLQYDQGLTVFQLRVVQLRDELSILYWESVVVRVVWNEYVRFNEDLDNFFSDWLLGWRIRFIINRFSSFLNAQSEA